MADGIANGRAKENFLTYAQTQFDMLAQRPLGPVDSLALSWLSYLHFPDDMPEVTTWQGVDIRELLRAECRDAMTGSLWDPDGSWDLLVAACANPRFRGMRACGYRTAFSEQSEEQFAAVTFRLPDGSIYVSYRGTDSTLVGWKEDFNMAFQSPVPAQVSAAKYLAEVAAALDGPIYTGGHSKGGNLSVYAATTCEASIQPRIERAFSHDGPGFNEKFLRDQRFLDMSERVDKTLPQSSIIGMIFENQEACSIVQSESFSILQHNPFSWQVSGTEFVLGDDLTGGAQYLDDSVAEWCRSVEPEQRGEFIDALFAVFNSAGQASFGDIMDTWQTSFPKMLQTVEGLDPEVRKSVTSTLGVLVKAMAPKLELPTIDSISDSLKSFIGLHEDAVPNVLDAPIAPADATLK